MIYFIVALSLVLRLVGSGQSLWLDEAISVLTSIKPFPFQITGINGDFQPPLYYLILHFFLKSGITAEWYIRLPSLIAGVLTVYTVYHITINLFNRKIALISSVILATSQFHIYYSQEARMYSFLALFTTLSMWFCYKKKWKSLIFAGILGIYTNYMFVFIFIPQILWFFLEKNYRPKNIKLWLKSLMIITLSFIPWLPVFFKQLQIGQKLTTELPLWSGLSALPFWKLLPQLFIKFTLGRISFDNRLLYLAVFFSILGVYGYVFSKFPKKITKEVKYVIIWLFAPLVSVIAVSFFIPIANVWRLIFLLVPFVILVSISLSYFANSAIMIVSVLMINIFGTSLYYLKPVYQRENWKEAVSMIKKNKAPVIFTVENGYAPFLWYDRKEKSLLCGPETIDKCLTEKKVYYVSYLKDLFMSENRIIKKLKKDDYKEGNVYNYPGVGLIYLYENRN